MLDIYKEISNIFKTETSSRKLSIVRLWASLVYVPVTKKYPIYFEWNFLMIYSLVSLFIGNYEALPQKALLKS